MQCCVIRAAFTDRTIRVYQAYRREIAEAALKAGTFVAPFSMNRMTWIKPSFNWMMYRCGCGCKPGQEFILGIDIKREGFEWALEHAALSSYQAGFHASELEWKRSVANSPVRVQWDPERNWRLGPIEGTRAIQIGLSGEAIRRYVRDWIVRLEDVTTIAHDIARAIENKSQPANLPHELERPYPLSPELSNRLAQTIIPID
jgi:hypothetical protein